MIMFCPCCKEVIEGLTGLAEAENFRAHLERCTKYSGNFVMNDGVTTVVTPKQQITLKDALTLRAESGQ